MERVLKAVGEVVSMSALRAVEDLCRVMGAEGVLIWRERRGRFGGEEMCDMSAWWLMTASILESVLCEEGWCGCWCRYCDLYRR